MVSLHVLYINMYVSMEIKVIWSIVHIPMSEDRKHGLTLIS